jgi:hypothetical protein
MSIVIGFRIFLKNVQNRTTTTIKRVIGSFNSLISLKLNLETHQQQLFWISQNPAPIWRITI